MKQVFLHNKKGAFKKKFSHFKNTYLSPVYEYMLI